MNIKKICKKFNLEGEFLEAKVVPVGNINRTFKVYYQNNGEKERYIVQRINKNVFKRPEQVMENILGISKYLQEKIKVSGADDERNVLHYMLTKDNVAYYKDPDGEYWRCYKFITDSETYNTTDSLYVIEQAGGAFGQFQKLLSDYDAASLYESIPNFHNTEVRFADFEDSVSLDVMNRCAEAKEEIDYLRSKKDLATSLCKMHSRGELPLRVTHNDTKCNNVLFDKVSGQALAVIDLDTVMPGLVAYDYGDAVRSIAATCDEDETDLSKICVDMDKLTAFTKGFVSTVADSLTSAEFDSLSIGIVCITLELASRFLKDYLDGDVYFKTNYQKHNLDRARCQIELSKQFEAHLDEVREIIDKYRK